MTQPPATNKASEPQRIVIAITGASGALYGIRAVESLKLAGLETHLIVSKSGIRTVQYETGLTLADLNARADVTYPDADIGAACASGSFLTLGMVIAPCSMKTLGAIASGVTDSLVSRAADVTLKDRRKLVLLTRETPLNLIHIRNMETVTLAGAIVAPPVPAFYQMPNSIDDLVDHTVGRVMDLLNVPSPHLRRWGQNESSEVSTFT